jgi:tRNA(Arg) A34 adenosine deaminase TadA
MRYKPIMSNQHIRIFEAIKSLAEMRPAVGRSRHVAAITYRDKIMGLGFNQLKSHPFQKKYGRHEDAIYLHAETSAIQNTIRVHGDEILEKCSMYVCRMKYVDTNKERMIQGLSRPCHGCAQCISTFGIKNVYFTCNEVGYEQL